MPSAGCGYHGSGRWASSDLRLRGPDDLHGGGSPGGVAQAYKVLERALPLLSPEGPPERREITIRTPFPGPGARDAFEMVTRAVTAGRYVVDHDLARPDLGQVREEKQDFADRLMAGPAQDAYDVAPVQG